MTEPANPARPLNVPAGRLNRFARLGGMTAGIAGNVALRALGEVARGTRPDMRQLLVTPGNMRRMADQLAQMRGAAMKLGQLISMDTGDVLPPEVADIMARLRDQADFMPPKQLRKVLDHNWGHHWLTSFKHFDVRPIAAASIGQVHRAELKDGRQVAIKVQYPGVARSIDSDVSNVGALVKMSGLLPTGFDLAPYLSEVRKQLHEETDYQREGAYLREFGDLLRGNEAFEVPTYHADWSTAEVLTMSYLPGQPIEAAAERPAAVRNGIMSALLDLTLREVFEFHLTQSDPNFANYRYNPETGKLILLDFGATRHLDADLIDGYRRLMHAGLTSDQTALKTAALEMRFIDGDGPFDAQILRMIMTVFSAVQGQMFDFADPTLSRDLHRQGMALSEGGYVPPPLPMDVLYLQRKFGGMFLLGSRLNAVVPVRAKLESYLSA
ncbi:MAG: AarF/ABC1/UbiB kinase family protein [Pseudomonadota bacterium]